VKFADAGWDDNATPNNTAYSHINPPAQPTYATVSRPAPRHNDGCNIVFVDGHVKWMKRDRPFYPAHPWAGNSNWTAGTAGYENGMWDLN
jgi:prepilin-type processing-associated H-X9-DG protein